jgi:hypothetical protein
VFPVIEFLFAELRMLKFSKILAVTAALGMPTAAFADSVATLSNASGKVLVNQGKGFVPVLDLVNLNVGDSIMVGADASAQIDYVVADCHITVNSQSLVKIAKKPNCKSGESFAQLNSVMIEPVNGTVAGIPPVAFAALGAVVLGGVILLAKKPTSSP